MAITSCWNLDEASGTRSDSVGSNHLTEETATTVGQGTGHVLAYAAEFAADSSLEVASNSSLEADGQWTIAVWFYPESSNVGSIGGKWEGTIGYEWLLYMNSATSVQLQIAGGGLVSDSCTADAWNLVIAWYDPIGNEAAIQINNGTPQTSTLGGTITAGASPVVFGRNPDSFAFGGQRFTGKLGPIQWHQGSILDSTERAALWNSGNGTACSNCNDALTAVHWDGTNYVNNSFPGGISGHPWTAYKNNQNTFFNGANDGYVYYWIGGQWVFQGIGDSAGDVYYEEGSTLSCTGQSGVPGDTIGSADLLSRSSLISRANVVYTRPMYWWKLDEGTGTLAADTGSAGRELDCTLGAGVSWTSDTGDDSDYALEWTADTDHALANSEELDDLSDFTVMMRIKRSANQSAGIGTAIGGWSFGVAGGISDSGKVFFVADPISGPGGDSAYSTATIAANEWVRIAATSNGLGQVKLYINGALDSTHNDCTWALDWINGNPYYLSGDSAGILMDDVRIYNRVLSDQQIANETSSTSVLSKFSLVANASVINDEFTSLLSRTQLSPIAVRELDAQSDLLSPSQVVLESLISYSDLQSRSAILAQTKVIKDASATPLVGSIVVSDLNVFTPPTILLSKSILSATAVIVRTTSLNLFLKGEELPTATESLDLFTYGSTTEGGLIIVDGEFVEGSGVDNSINLFLQGATSEIISGILPLFVQGGTTSLSSSLDLYLHRESGIGASLNLYISGYGVTPGAIPFSGQLPLYLERPTSAVLDLFLCVPGTPASSVIDMYILGSTTYNDSLDLYLSGVGFTTSTLKMYTHGW